MKKVKIKVCMSAGEVNAFIGKLMPENYIRTTLSHAPDTLHRHGGPRFVVEYLETEK